MARLSAATRRRMPKSEFAGPGKSFPVNDRAHARLAIPMATRSARAGNISASTAAHIKARARAKLHGRGYNVDHSPAYAHVPNPTEITHGAGRGLDYSGPGKHYVYARAGRSRPYGDHDWTYSRDE